MKILIADDHKMVLEGLELLLSTFDFVNQVSIAENYPLVKHALQNEAFDIILLDIAFGTADGRVVCKELKIQYPNLRFIALTSHGDATTIKSAINAGFDSYLLKSEDRDIIKESLLAVKEGKKYYSPKIQETIFLHATHSQQPAELTKRELEILQLIVGEKTTKEMAEILFISEKTVENHRANLMLKMDVKNIAGLVKKALMQGWV